jgi:hypothetical protein
MPHGGNCELGHTSACDGLQATLFAARLALDERATHVDEVVSTFKHFKHEVGTLGANALLAAPCQQAALWHRPRAALRRSRAVIGSRHVLGQPPGTQGRRSHMHQGLGLPVAGGACGHAPEERAAHQRPDPGGAGGARCGPRPPCLGLLAPLRIHLQHVGLLSLCTAPPACLDGTPLHAAAACCDALDSQASMRL